MTPSDAPDRPTLLYVAGWGRSGSTLLSRLLSAHPDVVYVGELRDLWVRGVQEDRPCGCGETFHGCAFWTAVGEEAYGGWGTQDARAMIALQHLVDRPWTPAALAAGGLRGPRGEALDAYVGMLQRVLRAIVVVTDGRTVVDSSKIASYALLLAEADVMDLHVAHLVRDSRGVVHSWRKAVSRSDDAPRDGEQPSYMPRYSPVTAVARYDLYNAQADRLAERFPYLRLRYEDVVVDPRGAVERLTAHAGLPAWDLDHVQGEGDDLRADLGPSHSVVGNPMRMRTGAVPLRRDDAWRDGLDAATRRAVTVATLPLLRRYGYVGAHV